MTSNRKRAARAPQPPGRLTRLQETQAAPRTGKTTALGKRAEKPSDGSERKGSEPAPEPSRRKAPSPRASDDVSSSPP
jgi:hypothetical protein